MVKIDWDPGDVVTAGVATSREKIRDEVGRIKIPPYCCTVQRMPVEVSNVWFRGIECLTIEVLDV